MAVKDIRRESVEKALAEFRDKGQAAMLEKYGGWIAKKWYVEVDGRCFDQKLIVRAAHVIQGMGELAPRGSVMLDAGQARSLLKKLGYRVVRMTED